MTLSDYENLKQTIEKNYRADLAALERVWILTGGSPAQERTQSIAAKKLGGKKKLSRAEAMKASWARRRKNELDTEKPLNKAAFAKFLVTPPSNGQ